MKRYIILVLCIAVLMLSGCAARPLVSADEALPSEDVLDYLAEVALSGFEFGSAPDVAYKWTHDVRVSVTGDLSAGDEAAVRAVIADLNELVAPLTVQLVPSGGDIQIHYGDDREFAERLPGYTPGNRGYFEILYSPNYSIRRADVLISTRVEAAARAHLVREELTQSMGFFQDSWAEPDSIFYQGWTTTNRYSALDEEIIRMLYDSRVKPGMTRARVLAALGA